jgi:glutamate N-acetyltransferase/amino-acid N-acetyltransferase
MSSAGSGSAAWTVAETGGGITAPAGFRTAGVACGIKASQLDLALIAADGPSGAAGLFTTNKAQAAPVVLSRAHLERSGGIARAVVINSGCANACTGAGGFDVARATAEHAAGVLGCRVEEVLVASTGVIGVALDKKKVLRGIEMAAGVLAKERHHDAARAIMTTDPWPKEAAVRIETPGGSFHVGGMAKGSGMIEPMLATMLGFLTTDARVAPLLLRRTLAAAVRDTFNAITVDGECSTNDCVVALASGASGVEIDEAHAPALEAGLRAVSRQLALGIVRGGEGATKLIAIRVVGARERADAERAARAIANSPLVKTAVHGGDPNWGRLIAAAGRAGVPFDLERAAVTIGGTLLFGNGEPHDEAAPVAAAYLKQTDVDIEVDLGTGGTHQATVWTCDLSAEYVKINAEYRT